MTPSEMINGHDDKRTRINFNLIIWENDGAINMKDSHNWRVSGG